MAPMINKNKMIINGEGEPSAAASNRRRIQLMNGVPFTNPITDHIHHHQQQQHRPSRNLPHSPPPAAIPVEEPAGDDDDDAFSSLIGQQNFIIDYHMNQMQVNVEKFWRRNFAHELKKRKEIETRLEQKEEQAGRFREMYHFYEERAFALEETLLQRKKVAGDGGGSSATAAAVEEVESCNYFDMNSVLRMEVACKSCRSRPATMLWLPCRHLCVCLVCERRVKTCPICGDRKTNSFIVNTP